MFIQVMSIDTCLKLQATYKTKSCDAHVRRTLTSYTLQYYSELLSVVQYFTFTCGVSIVVIHMVGGC